MVLRSFLARGRRLALALLSVGLLSALIVPAPARAQWPGDDRINPDPAEYYTVYCKDDQLSVYRADGVVLKYVPLTTLLGLPSSGGSVSLGSGMSVARSSDTITLSGSNGNYAGSGSKSFSLTTCLERNGILLAYYTPQQPTYNYGYNYGYTGYTSWYPNYTGYAGYTGYTGSACTYVVQYGDTLAGVALSHGVPLYQLADANGLNAYSWLYAGQTLTLPSCGTTTTTTTGSRIHIVQRGENLYRIGLAYGVPYTTIAAANGIVDPSRIEVGQRLVIP